MAKKPRFEVICVKTPKGLEESLNEKYDYMSVGKVVGFSQRMDYYCAIIDNLY